MDDPPTLAGANSSSASNPPTPLTLSMFNNATIQLFMCLVNFKNSKNNDNQLFSWSQ